MNTILESFHSMTSMDSFKRIDELHILNLYIGIDSISRYTLLLISNNKPPVLYSSQIISVQVGERADKKWAISFSLENVEFEEIFCHFCTDIIESSRLLTENSQDADFVSKRYIKWQNMLSKNTLGILSKSVVKGLVGELYFLTKYLIPLKGVSLALNSWIGPERAFQDFVCEDRWYEVKSTVSGAENIQISSIEQLDTESEGELVVVFLDKTSYSDNEKITLNSIYEQALDIIEDAKLKQQLTDILLDLGYYKRKEYDEYLFRFSSMQRYRVNLNFPCLRRIHLPSSVYNCKYTLSLAAITLFLEV